MNQDNKDEITTADAHSSELPCYIFIVEFFDWYSGGSYLVPVRTLPMAREYIKGGMKLNKTDGWKQHNDLKELGCSEHVIESYYSQKLHQGINIHMLKI